MIEEIKILNYFEAPNLEFKYWILFSCDILRTKKETNREVKKYLKSVMGEEDVRWKFQRAGEQYILRLKEPRDYTFLLLKMMKA
jgi:hypothetical protein